MASSGVSASAAFAALATAGVVHGQLIYVDRSNPIDNGNGSSWSQAFRDLQAAFDSLENYSTAQLHNASITFRISQGTYRPSQARVHAFRVGTMGTGSAASITIQGGYGGLQIPQNPNRRDFVNTPTILSGDTLGNDTPQFGNRFDNCHTVLASVRAAGGGPVAKQVSLDGLVLQGAYSNSSFSPGGGLYAYRNYVGEPFGGASSQYTLVDCVIRDNKSGGSGGGISGNDTYTNSRTGFQLTRCLIEGNRSDENGGGARFLGDDLVDIQDCTFANNSADAGGGLTIAGYTRLSRVRVVGNQADSHGGGAYQIPWPFPGSSYEFTSCLFADNSAGSLGGALYLLSGSLRGCTIVHNSAAYGGGAFIADDFVYFSNSIITENSASIGGASLAGGGSQFPALTAMCVDRRTSTCYFPFTNQLPSIQFGVADFIDSAGLDHDPLTWEDNNYRLLPHSPLIDAGALSSQSELDIEGNPRNGEGVIGRGRRLDLGCYESQLTLCPTDLNADGGVTVDDLLGFLLAFELGQPLADLTTNGTTPFPDGAVTVEDLLFFLAKFEQGC